jgi:hypothetical protein
VFVLALVAGCKDNGTERPAPATRPDVAPEATAGQPGAKATTAGVRRLEPLGCDPVMVALLPPDGFERMSENGEPWMVRWKREAAGGPPFEFLSVDAVCVGENVEPADVDARVRHLRKVLVDDQKEHPFASSGDPVVQKLRQKVEVVADEARDGRRFLEIRTTYPDGVPGGFVFEKYDGFCWRHDPGSDVAIEVRYKAPLALEPEARRSLAELCRAVSLVR